MFTDHSFSCMISKNIKLILIYLGLLSGVTGDAILLKQEFFSIGLTSFLLGHVLYSISFLQHKPKITPVSILMFFSLSFGLNGYLIYSLYIHRSAMLIPVILYIAAITFMALLAFSLFKADKQYRLLFIGAVLFYVSDFFLAIFHFINSIIWLDIIILYTYYAAQTLIIISTGKNFLTKES